MKPFQALVAATALVLGILAMWPAQDANAISPGVVAQLGQAEPAAAGWYNYAGNASVTCANNAAFNPDAGTGLLLGGATTGPCAGDAHAMTVINDSATAVYIGWRAGLTAANYTSVSQKICNAAATCPVGAVYNTDVNNPTGNLFCIATGATPAVTIHCKR